MHSGLSPDPGSGDETAALLEVRDLALSRGGRVICRQLSFGLSAGERLELSGANGAGKTTLLRVLAGLSDADEGSVRWRGCREARERYPGEMTYIGHKSGMKPELSVRENLRFYLSLKPTLKFNASGRGGAAGHVDTSIEKAIAQLGLAELADVPCAALSEGQRRRGALARLPLERAALWLLDEPAATLDGAGTATLTALLAEHARGGGVAVVATHRPLDGADKHLELPWECSCA